MNSIIFDLLIIGSVPNIYADASSCNSDYSGFQMTIDPKEILKAKREIFE